ncbi:SusC/RagA family TonB-linked outer membrane protein [Chitinophaga sp. MD30]|uniref:SusC/RagA family TonB-linked outer membrane protein n=2 Tax=Chitinophaga TaxID=79328 RepID=UPI001CEC2807|nr:SusC/RagA family TonB-linked outer membrane protein [Chitinophaga sp. MD30]
MVTGKVSTPDGTPLPGATVKVKGSNRGGISNASGIFVLNGMRVGDRITVSYTSYENAEVLISGNTTLDVHLKEAMSNLDETVVIAYGTTTRRLNTGNVSQVSGKDIAQQPVSNPLAALEGRVPGMVVTQNNGNPGAGFKVQIRGVTSVGVVVPGITLNVSNDPLFIIDGVPFAPNNTSLSSIGNFALGEEGLSPFASINPSDIESIDVLKDADATAIYGSRGANGVVLITTKKGKPGRTQLNVGMYTGFSKVGRMMKLMNTQEYLQMRREAFANDNVPVKGPEFDVFDTTRYTDFSKLLLGEPAPVTRVNVSLSGGNERTRFLIGAQYSQDKMVYKHLPGQNGFTNRLMSVNTSLNHSSVDKKLNVMLSASYSTYDGNLAATDPAKTVANFQPNYPSFFDNNGQLVWQYKGVSLNNPFADLYNRYESHPDNLLGNLNVSYELIRGLTIRSSFGYSNYLVKESVLRPRKALDPLFSAVRTATFSNNQSKSWIVEPQLEYIKGIGRGTLQVLVGSTWQQNTTDYSQQYGEGYISDDLLKSIRSATTIRVSNSYQQYRYQAVFGRINYNWEDKYILNISGRRDGSSRFGPDRQFANFGAAGIAWLFSRENFASNYLPFLSLGKIRGSYGSAGNDKIGDYKYLDSWASIVAYQIGNGLYPDALFNPEYNWEVNRKLEAALELGFFKNRILFTASWYRNRSTNQLVDYLLSAQTGFSSIVQNLPAKVQNTGLELELNTVNITTRDFKWKSGFNISFNRNKLLSFPDLGTSSYSGSLVIGEPLTVLRGFHLIGVDANTGLFQFEDVNKDGKVDQSDRRVLNDLAPRYFGGLNNEITYKGWRLSFFLSFKKQIGKNYLSVYPIPALGDKNPPAFIIGHYWRKPGDQAELQRLTQNYWDADIRSRNTMLRQSDGIYGDASYIRLKNISLGYALPAKWMSRLHLQDGNISFSVQNLLTITNYKGGDPEVLNFSALPVFKTFAIGINLSL